MDPDGSNPTNLTKHPGDDFGSTWAPDGSAILFYSERDGNSEIYRMAPDGSNQTNLTNNPGTDFASIWVP